MKTIDLAKYRSGGTRVYAGRERGEKVRQSADLDSADRAEEIVEVQIPSEIFAVTSSFFLGMFTDSIERLGETGFREKYRFVGKDISSVYESGIREALAKSSPFRPL